MKKPIILLMCLSSCFELFSQETLQSVTDRGAVTTNEIKVPKLHIPGNLTGEASIRIGEPYSPGNINVPVGGVTGGYNIDFYTWRDVQPVQTGARIRAERSNNYEPNNALVQSMDLVFYTSFGFGEFDLSEKMRIKSNGFVGLGTSKPNARLDIMGGLMFNSNITNRDNRPIIEPGTGFAEIRGYSSNGPLADDGFLRISAGAGTNANTIIY
ncbi:hypothetical protein [Pararcticibacter amylolyticus]|uniref:Uncharacterized protein n=1 Tax=Pararcticibacter amylolyticus TaxID=2173175 RepID=A0A2U2P9K9_9SPHI|nr:hypothetical protein [Pararcticibacter amylolyticus]PWG78071.1 hypothetical protein DDR33_24170 [Pararcticibacter amylolyticus]